MKRAHLVVITTALVIGSAGSFWVWSRAQAEVIPEPEVMGETSEIEPAPKPEPEKPKEDPRIINLKDRGDGARLLWAPEGGMTLLRAGFVDNQTMAMTATTTGAVGKGYRFFSFDLLKRSIIAEMKHWNERRSSASRPAHKNADAFCFSEKNENRVFEIWCSNYDWNNPKRLTIHDGREDLVEPAISPDGSWVAFEVNTDRVLHMRKIEGATGTSTVWKVGLNGAGMTQLTRGADDRFPTWSEDGRNLFFQRRNQRGDWDVYAMNADGSNPHPIMHTVDDDERWPTPVADTGKIVAVVGPLNETGRMKLINLETKSAIAVTSGAYGPETVLSVSPDGHLVSFLAPVDPADPSRLGLWIKAIE